MRLGVYLADQVFERTLSKGIYSYSRTLVAQLLARLPEHEILLIVNPANRGDMLPPQARVRCVELPSACASGVARLAADHLAAPVLARRLRLDLIHFPKGFVPRLGCGRARISATLHDTIPLFYAERHPGQFSRAKLAYLRSMYLNSLRRCRGILTDSHFSRAALLELAADARIAPPPIEVCAPSPDPVLSAADGPAETGERQLLHLGSRLPHKRTRETIRLFAIWNERNAGAWRLRVTGFDAWPPEWGAGQDLAGVDFVGAPSLDELRRELRSARALLLLSSIEGFGLPALEAWFLGTPVCYAAEGALPEILAGLPGRWDGSDAGFVAAIEQILALTAAERDVIRAVLWERYRPEAFGACAASRLRAWLGA